MWGHDVSRAGEMLRDLIARANTAQKHLSFFANDNVRGEGGPKRLCCIFLHRLWTYVDT